MLCQLSYASKLPWERLPLDHFEKNIIFSR